MVELLEYALVVLVSGLVTSFSVATYSTFSTSIANAGDRATFSSYVTLAYAALQRGNANASLSLSGASLYCSAGSLGFKSSSFSATTTFPTPCDFSYPQVSGTHLLSFRYSGGALYLEVR